jgi:GrpB-like predicted nucleotidyltransferase (UPF0157 family)
MTLNKANPQIEIVPYDSTWPEQFARERDALLPTLASWLAGPIEHVGSTAVKGLPAKPVIDIMVPVHGLKQSRPAIALLHMHGYVYFPYKADEMHWFCKPDPYRRTHHVHMVPIDSPLFRARLAFRDALRKDNRLRERYAQLKHQLAGKHPHDREAYTDGKGPFVSEVLDALGRDESSCLLPRFA